MPKTRSRIRRPGERCPVSGGKGDSGGVELFMRKIITEHRNGFHRDLRREEKRLDKKFIKAYSSGV
jgi:hypothetical protein